MAPARRVEFDNLYAHGFVRVAASAPVVKPADPAANADEMLAIAQDADARNVALVVFAELGLSGYAIDDLLLQDALLDGVERHLARMLEESRGLTPVLVVGAPVRLGDALYNAAVVMHRGRILGVTPKTYLPNYREFYEKRHFAAGDEAQADEITVAGQTAPFGSKLLYAARDVSDFVFHIEICEDIWSATPPSSIAALAGATVLCNLSASNITIGKSDERNILCDAQSRRCVSAYLYSTAGHGESTTDLAWDGHLAIFEYGELLAENGRFATTSQLISADIDVERLRQERRRMPTFRDAARRNQDAVATFRRVEFDLGLALDKPAPLERNVPRFPYVPDDPAALDQDCFEAYNIQVHGLMTRLKAAKINKVVIGISGGLDSTHALLVTAKAFDLMGLPRKNIIGLTMPGFATSASTNANAKALMAGLGVDARELDIKPAAEQMLKDIGHPAASGEAHYDVTYENVQAGLRTDYLFRIANHEGGLVVGTGDLSELALGWCTYGVGDHMSHYNVNASVAKTLIQHLIRWCVASGDYDDKTSDVLLSILNTEISPELVPADAAGNIQSTEDTVGPYALADFALFYITRYGLRPSKILFMAEHAWGDKTRGDWPPNLVEAEKREFAPAELRKWLRNFLWRFFEISQFKRSCVPNGPKISSGGALSPRGDWRAPSDATAIAWLEELDAAFQEIGER